MAASPPHSIALAFAVGFGAAVLGCTSHPSAVASESAHGVEPPPAMEPSADGGADAGADATVPVADAGDLPDAGDADDATTSNIDASAPARLSATGLYADIAHHVVADGMRPFEPAFALWSDGAEKRRWISLPAGAVIDSSDMDHWSFPVGTRFFKEFVVGGKRIETRLIERVGPRRDDFLFATYAWSADETDAELVPLGRTNANGSGHDIPAVAQCTSCHGYLPEHVLGFGAVMLDRAPGAVTLESLGAAGLLSVARPKEAGALVPGDATARAALGYLHANCSNCHNTTGVRFPTQLDLRLSARDVDVESTAAYRTAVGVRLERFVSPGFSLRIAPGEPSSSAIAYRMGTRGTLEQMPPTATKEVDATGNEAVRTWIAGLPK